MSKSESQVCVDRRALTCLLCQRHCVLQSLLCQSYLYQLQSHCSHMFHSSLFCRCPQVLSHCSVFSCGPQVLYACELWLLAQ